MIRRNKRTKKQVKENLYNALLLDGEMSYSLFEFELNEHIDYWKEGMIQDKDEFVFIVTENKGDVAMLLITKKGDLFINEDARFKLQSIWKMNGVYKHNIELLLPHMAEQLYNDVFSVNGVKHEETVNSRR